MFSCLHKGLLGITTLSYVLISCRALTAIDTTNVEVIQVAEGKSFTLNCPVGITSNTSNEVHWFHEGRHLGGIEVVKVTRSNSSHGGIYICSGTAGNKTMYVIIGNKTVPEGGVLELHCKGEKTNASHNQDMFWTKNGEVLTNWTGMENFTVLNAQLNDGGVYICNDSGQVTQTNVVVGKLPSLPPEPQCLDSSNTVIQCIAYPGEFHDANKICITVESIELWFQYPQCHSCFTGNGTATCYVDFNEQWHTEYVITTEVENYVTSSRRTVAYENLQKKVIPDQPTVVNMTATGVDSFTTWFRIPKTWDEKINIFARGLYTQNGVTHIANVPEEDKYNSYSGQYGIFLFKTEEYLAYSLVCWQIQIRYHYGFRDTTWSTPSEPVCEYTFMTAPSEKPEELNATSEQEKESPELRNVTFSWKPPLEQYRNGIIDHYQLVLNREGLTKEDGVRNETIPANITNITFTGIESYETFSAKLTAWTQVGPSPPRHVVIDPIPRKNIALRRMLGIAITMISIIFLIILGRITWITRRKISANHLPEPYFIPEEKMKECLAKKRFLPRQKEVFDVLKGKAEESSTDICDDHDSSDYACTTTSSQVYTSFVSCSKTGSNVLQDTSHNLSSGASCCMLVSSTDSAMGTDDTVGSDEVVSELGHDSESKSSTNDDSQNYRETEIDVVNEFDLLKVTTGKRLYGELGCYDGEEHSCHEYRPYVNFNFGAPQGDGDSKGQTLQLCNDTENPGYNIIETREVDEDQNYQNYTSFEFRVHDTMTKLNRNIDVV